MEAGKIDSLKMSEIEFRSLQRRANPKNMSETEIETPKARTSCNKI